MSSQNFIKTKTDKKVWEKNTIVSGDDREKQKLQKEVMELRKEQYQKLKERESYFALARW